jgi:transcriptional regulator with XRE-family HTH domain
MVPLMHTMSGAHIEPDLPTHVRGEIRAQLARMGVTRFQLAARMDVSADWISRRLAGSVGATLEDVQKIADGLGIDVRTLLP